MDKNVDFYEKYCRKILVGIIDLCQEEILGKNLINFFESIGFDGGYLPQSFITEYELDRLEFDGSGKLTKMNENKRKMILIYYLIFYQFLNRVFTKPW